MKKLTFNYLKNRHETQNVFDKNPILITLFAQDRGDYGIIYEDRSVPEAERYNYLFFTCDDLSDNAEPHEHFKFDNAPEAILHFSYRYIIDNHADADTNVPEAKEKHDTFSKKILNLCKFFH